MQADEGLATEQAVALAGHAGVDIEARFQGEDALQAATEVFHATQAPTRAGQVARVHAHGRLAIAARHVARHFYAGVDDAIQGDVGRGLGEGCAGRCAGSGCRQGK
ncbi:hypothetical protein D3C86_1292190 [compost metagenome]